MISLTDTLYTIARALVSCPDEVTVTGDESGKNVNLVLSVAPDDMGMVIGKPRDEAIRLCRTFLRMIRGEASEEEIDSLEEASALRDVAHMPARVKCAMLGWRTLAEALGEHLDH